MTQSPSSRGSLTRGIGLAVAAAVSFGAATPFLQRFGRDVGVFTTAALLYTGAALASFLRGRAHAEARVRRADAPRLAAVAVLGACIAPVFLVWGLQRTSGTSASLMLNLEAGFTVALGRILYREHLGTRVVVAALLIALGGALLILDHGLGSDARSLGLLAVLAASLAWALDNALGKPLAERDVGVVVRIKCALGASLSAVLAIGRGEAFPWSLAAVGILGCGAIGYGASLRLYLLAQRKLGAARTASVFAVAPFVGAMMAWSMGDHVGIRFALAAALMLVGVWLHVTERHEHEHHHLALEHDHAHTHDDGHHDHAHDPMPLEPHAHPHRHEPRSHVHPHTPDAHHSHPHDTHDPQESRPPLGRDARPALQANSRQVVVGSAPTARKRTPVR